MKTPNEQLAESIALELEKCGLVQPQDISQLEEKLATGALTAEDWLFFAENSLEKRVQP